MDRNIILYLRKKKKKTEYLRDIGAYNDQMYN